MSMTAEVLYKKLKEVKMGGLCQYSLKQCEELAKLINEIEVLKASKNAVILAHSYVTPEIIYGVADFVGDSYKLSKDAAETKADVIVFSAVRFMAETAKILSPDKEVLIPSQFNGCSLADSITGEEVRELKKKYPDYTFICYINTTADVKAECHSCVTSSNVYDIVAHIKNENIFFLPDYLMGKNIIEEMNRRGIKKNIRLHDGTCYVHEEYNPQMIDSLRKKYPGLLVLAHPECSPQVAKKADYVGSTSQMLEHVKKTDSETYLMLTECGLIGRLEVEYPAKKFVGTCMQCRYMKSNTLVDIKRVLSQPSNFDRIEIDDAIRVDAKKSIDQMFAYVEEYAVVG